MKTLRKKAKRISAARRMRGHRRFAESPDRLEEARKRWLEYEEKPEEISPTQEMLDFWFWI